MTEEAWKFYWSRKEVAERFGYGENFTRNCSKVSGEELPIAKVIPESKSLLDAGCGPGRYIHYLNGKVDFYVCADLSREMLDVAKKRNKHKNIHFVRCDLEYLPFLSQTFETVLCVSVLRHLPYKKGEKVFKSLLDITKDKFFFTAYFSPDLGVVGIPPILDHNFELTKLEEWASPYKPKKEVELTNDRSKRYLFCVRLR